MWRLLYDIIIDKTKCSDLWLTLLTCVAQTHRTDSKDICHDVYTVCKQALVWYLKRLQQLPVHNSYCHITLAIKEIHMTNYRTSCEIWSSHGSDYDMTPSNLVAVYKPFRELYHHCYIMKSDIICSEPVLRNLQPFLVYIPIRVAEFYA
jgi:hypothetical protein